jgi:hypothetical protein
MERHFARTDEGGNGLVGQAHREDEAGTALANITTHGLGVEPHLVADDGKSVGLVGATICFTPQPSPRSSPNLDGARGVLSNICSLSGESSNYIGDLLAYATGSGTEGASTKLRTSAVQIASSLDGRSTSDYEMLDGISSKGTIEIEDLSVDDDSISSTLPSLNCREDHEVNFGSPIAEKTESPLVFKTMLSEEHHDETLILEGVSTVREPSENDDSPVSLQRVDDHALPPFYKVRKFWEGKSSFTTVVMGRTNGTETTQAAHSEESTTEEGTLPSDTLVGVSMSSAFVRVMGAFILITASTLSFIASASALVSINLSGYIMYILNIAKATFGRNGLNITGRIRTDNRTKTDPPHDEVNKADINDGDPHGLTRTNLSKLFFLEALKGKTISRKLAETTCRSESDEQEREKAILKTINDDVTAGIVIKCRRLISGVNLEASRFAAVVICIIISSIVNFFRKSMETPREEQDDLFCVRTKLSTFISVPFLELILSPAFSEDGYHVFDETPNVTVPRSWLSTTVVVSVTIFLFCVFAFTSMTAFPATKSKMVDVVLTGIWSEEEHHQFLEGYNVHGSHWKLVSSFVPTRNHAQVRAHGNYWLKVHSPLRMKKSRKQDPIIGSASPDSSSKGTPRRSNQTMATPKGILREKDQNQSHNHVTPKKERNTANLRGSKSDPIKRVKFEAL